MKNGTSVYDNLDLLPKDLQGWNGTSLIFKKLIQEVSPKIVVEVGSWKGQSALTMARCVTDLNLSSKIYCIDTWLGSTEFWTSLKDTPERDLHLKNGYPQIYYQFLSNVVHEGMQELITPIVGTSSMGLSYLKYFNIIPQLIYIDASHEEDDVYYDVKHYYNHLDSRGIIFGDDFKAWPGVRKGLDRFIKEADVQYEVVDSNFWIIRKNNLQ